MRVTALTFAVVLTMIVLDKVEVGIAVVKNDCVMLVGESLKKTLASTPLTKLERVVLVDVLVVYLLFQ